MIAGADTITRRPEAGRLEATCTVTVSEDKLAAYLHLPVAARCCSMLEEIARCLVAEQIEYGIIEEREILSYLTAEPALAAPLLVAQGTAPEPGLPGEIRYYFDVHPLKAGTEDSRGGMDFKDRGTIPQVKEGDLLAEKIPSTPGKPGRDVFGKPVAAPKAQDCVLVSGKGVRRSDDRLTFYAGISGRPVLAEDGTVCVLPDLQVDGDVGFETGHIDFDGFVSVAGMIESGFKVKAKRLEAIEVDNGELQVAGDIVVEKGVVGSAIEGGSVLRAHHIDMSQIKAGGDVVVESEIFGSTIVCNGCCIVEGGRIVSSQITAMMGIVVETIGSEESKPCSLTVGINSLSADNLRILESQAGVRHAELLRLETRVKELTRKSERINEQIGRLAQEEDQAQVRLRALQAKAEENRARTGKPMEQAEKLVVQLRVHAAKLHDSIETLFDDDDRMQNQIEECRKEIGVLSEESQRIEGEIERRKESADGGEGLAEIRVSGTAYAGTVVSGPHATMTFRENLSAVIFREVEVGPPDADERWEIQVVPLS